MDSTLLDSLVEMAGIDVQMIPRPMNTHIVTPGGIPATLDPYGLRPIPGSPSSFGANLLGDATLNISDDNDGPQNLRTLGA